MIDITPAILSFRLALLCTIILTIIGGSTLFDLFAIFIEVFFPFSRITATYPASISAWILFPFTMEPTVSSGADA